MTDHDHVWKKQWTNGTRTVFKCVVKGCDEKGYPTEGGHFELSSRRNRTNPTQQQLHDSAGARQDPEVPRV